jgi:hypothetical protein
MATLSGEVIERMLWEGGIDFSHLETDEFGHGIEMVLVGRKVYLWDIWFEGEDWFVDTEFLQFVLTKWDGESSVHDEPVSDEKEFINYVLWMEAI